MLSEWHCFFIHPFAYSHVRRYEERYKNTEFLSLIIIFGQKCLAKSSIFIEMFNKSVVHVSKKH